MKTQTTSLFEGWKLKNENRPVIISGPCSAESEEQVLDIARQLNDQNIEILRAGIWKPRTRPNSFEGVGSVGLEWLKLAKQEYDLKIATEVANVKHVYEALKAGVDILWIGARTTVNPFAIQEIADALKGVDIPVLVKNPINPDVDLWQGAIERIAGAGIEKIGAIHRGFSSFDKTKYRNAPKWQLPIELRRRLPELPMICDPSHIAGQRDLIQRVSQKSMDLNYDGLMIECHNNPDEAWSDAKQQVSPEQLKEILASLILRELAEDNPNVQHDLEELRGQIDEFDRELFQILEERMKVAEKIGLYKKANNITVLQPDRWQEILEKTIEQGKSHDLSSEFVTKIFTAIHQESINKQTKLMRD